MMPSRNETERVKRVNERIKDVECSDARQIHYAHYQGQRVRAMMANYGSAQSEFTEELVLSARTRWSTCDRLFLFTSPVFRYLLFNFSLNL